jgi:hypothetical protein
VEEGVDLGTIEKAEMPTSFQYADVGGREAATKMSWVRVTRHLRRRDVGGRGRPSLSLAVLMLGRRSACPRELRRTPRSGHVPATDPLPTEAPA